MDSEESRLRFSRAKTEASDPHRRIRGVERLYEHQQSLIQKRADVFAAASSPAKHRGSFGSPRGESKRVARLPALGVSPAKTSDLGMKPRPFPTPEKKKAPEEARRRPAADGSPAGPRVLRSTGGRAPIVPTPGLRRLLEMEAVDGGAPSPDSRFNSTPRGVPIAAPVRLRMVNLPKSATGIGATPIARRRVVELRAAAFRSQVEAQTGSRLSAENALLAAADVPMSADMMVRRRQSPANISTRPPTTSLSPPADAMTAAHLWSSASKLSLHSASSSDLSSSAPGASLKFLPLEAFDVMGDVPMTAGEKKLVDVGPTPVDSPISAVSRFYSPAGTWEWRPCVVLFYSPRTHLFRIRWVDSNVTKDVSRLNIMFDGEDRSTWSARAQIVEDLRKDSEAALREHFFLEDLPAGPIAAMPPAMLAAIRSRVGAHIDLKAFPGALDVYTSAAQSLWTSAQKLSLVHVSLQTDRGFRAAYDELELPRPADRPPAPASAKAIETGVDVPGLLSQLQMSALVGNSRLARAVADIHSILHSLSDLALVRTSDSGRIFSLESFRTFQRAHRLEVIRSLRVSCPSDILAVFKSVLGVDMERIGREYQTVRQARLEAMAAAGFYHAIEAGGPDTFKGLPPWNTVPLARKSQYAAHLPTLVALISQMTAVSLRAIVANSIAVFDCMFAAIYEANAVTQLLSPPTSAPPPPPTAGSSSRPSLGARTESVGSAVAAAAIGETPLVLNGERISSFGAEYLVDLAQTPLCRLANPLFAVDVVLELGEDSDYQAVFLPPLSEFSSCTTELYDSILATVTDYPDFASLAHLSLSGERRLFESTGLDLEADVAAGCCRYETLIQALLTPASAYQDSLGVFLTKLNPSLRAEYLTQFRSVPRSVEDYKLEISKHEQAALQITHSVPASKPLFGVFQVNVEPFRSALVARCTDVATAFKTMLWEEAQSDCSRLRAQFEEMDGRLKETPSDPTAWGLLMDYVKNLPGLVEDKQAAISEMMEKYELLEDVGVPISNHDFRLKWEAYAWPKRILVSTAKSQIALRQAEQGFKNSLSREKRDFEILFNRIQSSIGSLIRLDDLAGAENILAEFKDLDGQLKDAVAMAAAFTDQEALFGVEASDYSHVTAAQDRMAPYLSLWTYAAAWSSWHTEWYYGEFTKLDPANIISKVDEIRDVLAGLAKDFEGSEPRLPFRLIADISTEINAFAVHIPLITALRNNGLRDRHWMAMARATGVAIKPDYEMTLSTMLTNLHLLPTWISAIQEISELASNEHALELSLESLQTDWEDVMFQTRVVAGPSTAIITNHADVFQMVEDQITQTQSMARSPYVRPILERVSRWEARLARLLDILDEWARLQHHWLYLEPIFRTGDIVDQMPVEGRRFSNVDAKYRQLMAATVKNSRVLTLTSLPKILETLTECNKLLENVTKGLNEYLDSKRSSFPRFYFISNSELLELLSKSSDPSTMQSHLLSVFSGVSSLVFGTTQGAGSTITTGFKSVEGELIDLRSPVSVSGRVEVWLARLETEMKATMRAAIAGAQDASRSSPVAAFASSHPIQLAQLIYSINFVRSVEEVLLGPVSAAGGGLGGVMTKLVNDASELSQALLGTSSSVGRLQAASLLALTIQFRDLVELLRAGAANSLPRSSDFAWLSALKYYWADDSVTVRGGYSAVEYGYEHSGAVQRLVVGPDTAGASLAMFSAVADWAGSMVAGPSGAGKTALIQDLAIALGKHAVTFAASGASGVGVLTNFLLGAIASASFIIFKGFDSVAPSVLSIMAESLAALSTAVGAKSGSVSLNGTVANLDTGRRWGVFAVVSPGWVSAVPDNVKTHFRPVSVAPPPLEPIATVLLTKEGFSTAKPLASRLGSFVSLAASQLSCQPQYDFSLRTLHTTIRIAGILLRDKPAGASQALILRRALAEVLGSKILPDELPMFNALLESTFSSREASAWTGTGLRFLIGDVGATTLGFLAAMRSRVSARAEGSPSTKLAAPSSGEPAAREAVQAALSEFLVERSAQAPEAVAADALRLYDATKASTGVVLLGESGAGKTYLINVLVAAMNKAAASCDRVSSVSLTTINPNAVARSHLYGSYTHGSREWSDGILAGVLKGAAGLDNLTWVVFDGDMDPEWMRPLRTALDGSHLLCLDNGERMVLPPTVSLLFETTTAGPESGDVFSRSVVVPVANKLGGWPQAWAASVAGLPQLFGANSNVARGALSSWSDVIIPWLLNVVPGLVPEPAPWLAEGPITSRLLAGYSGLIKAFDDAHPALSATEVRELPATVGAALLSSTLTLLAPLTPDSDTQSSLSSSLEEVVTQAAPQLGSIPWPPLGNLGGPQSLFDLVFDPATGRMREIPGSKPGRVFIPLPSAARNAAYINDLVRVRKHVLLAGPRTAGKTALIEYTLRSVSVPVVRIKMTPAVDADYLRAAVQGKIQRRRKGVWGPAGAPYIVLVFDDLHIATTTTRGLSALDLLRQWMDHGGWYDSENQFIRIQDIVVVAIAAGEALDYDTGLARLLPHFSLVQVAGYSDTEWEDILRQLMFGSIKHEVVSSRAIETAIRATVDLAAKARARAPSRWANAHQQPSGHDSLRLIKALIMGAGSVSAAREIYPLWVHEAHRVFVDRLQADSDVSEMASLINSMCLKHWETLTWTPEDGLEPIPPAAGTPLLFSAIEHGDGDRKAAVRARGRDTGYRQVQSLPDLTASLELFILEYNSAFREHLSLIMFSNTVEHVVRLSRVLTTAQGHILLAGKGGSSRRSVVATVAAIHNHQLATLGSSNHYELSDWRSDIRKILKTAGLDGNPVVLMISDSQLCDPLMWHDLNSLLVGIEPPNFWPTDDLELIFNVLRPVAKTQGLPETRTVVHKIFMGRVRSRLHVVLNMNPTSPTFIPTLQANPGILQAVTIDTYREWSADALLAVGSRYLEPMDSLMPGLPTKLAPVAVQLHQAAIDICAKRATESTVGSSVTATHYMELFSQFQTIVTAGAARLSQEIADLEGSLNKLNSARKVILELEDSIAEKTPVLENLVKRESLLVAEIEREEAALQVATAGLTDARKHADSKARQLKVVRADAERDIKSAIPQLDAATNALRGINKRDLNDIRSGKPHSRVMLVMEAICILKGITPRRTPGPAGYPILDYWPEVKLLIADPKFTKHLAMMDRDRLSANTIERLKPYLRNPEFTTDGLGKINKAVKTLCSFVLAIVNYSLACEDDHPMKLKLEKTQMELDECTATVETMEVKVASIGGRLEELKASLTATAADRASTVAALEKAQTMLAAAIKVVDALTPEGAVWESRLAGLRVDKKTLFGDSLLAAGLVTYAGPLSAAYRQDLIGRWVAVLEQTELATAPGGPNLSLLAESATFSQWEDAGLPPDRHSAQNAVIMDKSQRFPMIFDPQGSAANFILGLAPPEVPGLVLSALDPDLVRSVAECVPNGRSVVIKGKLGPTTLAALEPLLMRRTFVQSGKTLVRIGGQPVEYSAEFRLYNTLAQDPATLASESYSRFVVIDFSVSREALSGRLVSLLLQKEKPSLEQQRVKLRRDLTGIQFQLDSVNRALLALLGDTKGSVLEDEAVVASLIAATSTAAEWTSRKTELEAAYSPILEAVKPYQAVVARLSSLYFSLQSMAAVSELYRWSLTWFESQVTSAFVATPSAGSLSQRLAWLSSHAPRMVFEAACASISPNHHVLFALRTALDEFDSQFGVSRDELEFFLAAFSTTEPKDGAESGDEPNSARAASGLSAGTWELVELVGSISGWEGLVESVEGEWDLWAAWLSDGAGIQAPPPGKWARLTVFQRLILARVLGSASRFLAAVEDFVAKTLGPGFVDPEPPSADVVYRQASAMAPILYIVQPGQTPMPQIKSLSETVGLSRKPAVVSLGEGRGEYARDQIVEGIDRGRWVILENCHLLGDWLPAIEEIYRNLAKGRAHSDFRLWLVTQPCSSFPPALVKRCVKIMLNPPKSLGGKIGRLLADSGALREFTGSQSPRVNALHRPLVFCLAALHANLQHRAQFGPAGWSGPSPSFGLSDFVAADALLRETLAALSVPEDFPFSAVQASLVSIVYAGAVQSDPDRRLLTTLVADFVSPAMLCVGEPLPGASPDGPWVVLPPSDLRDFQAALRKLPARAPAELFGVHPAADRLDDEQKSVALVKALAMLPPIFPSLVEQPLSAVVPDLVDSLLEQLSEVAPRDEHEADLGPTDPNSDAYILSLEVSAYSALLATILRTLVQLRGAIEGELPMSEATLSVMSALGSGDVPKLWAESGVSGPAKLIDWVSDLLRRWSAVRSWAETGILPTVVDISVFARLAALLGRAKLRYVRNRKIGVSAVAMVLREAPENPVCPPDAGFYVCGMGLAGGRLDSASGLLVPEGPPTSNLGAVWLCPVEVSDLVVPQMQGTYNVALPLIAGLGRPCVPCDECLLESEHDQAFWARRGACVYPTAGQG